VTGAAGTERISSQRLRFHLLVLGERFLVKLLFHFLCVHGSHPARAVFQQRKTLTHPFDAITLENRIGGNDGHAMTTGLHHQQTVEGVFVVQRQRFHVSQII